MCNTVINTHSNVLHFTQQVKQNAARKRTTSPSTTIPTLLIRHLSTSSGNRYEHQFCLSKQVILPVHSIIKTQRQAKAQQSNMERKVLAAFFKLFEKFVLLKTITIEEIRRFCDLPDVGGLIERRRVACEICRQDACLMDVFTVP